MRRLMVVASIVVFVDVAFYSAIVPLLPCYVIAAILLVSAASVRRIPLSLPGGSASRSPAQSA